MQSVTWRKVWGRAVVESSEKSRRREIQRRASANWIAPGRPPNGAKNSLFFVVSCFGHVAVTARPS
jgi:hypothetical protein